MESKSQKIKEDTLRFIEYNNPFWDEVVKSSNDFVKEEKKDHKSLKMDFTGIDLPKLKDFKQIWHNDPVPQAWTNICWSFCATSMYESEVFRLQNKKVKLSEPWTSYWEYIEKANYFIETRGKSLFAEGSQANAVKRIYKKYGVVPVSVFSGLLPGQKYLDQHKMFEEMSTFLEYVKKNSVWNEEFVISTLKNIMHKFMLTPPEKFNYEGLEYTPKSFLSDYLKLNLEDYVDVISILEPGYWKRISYEVPDNWWHDKSYYNVPLEEYMSAIKNAVKAGYTLAIGGDVSEPGLYSFDDIAMIPSWDIPSAYINDKARQFRFTNNTTTDDHGIHIVGSLIKNGIWWFLIKDSGSGARNGNAIGYYFYHEDYIKLKMMTFSVHKDAVKDLLQKFK
jgi:bleomycin hydrolase